MPVITKAILEEEINSLRRHNTSLLNDIDLLKKEVQLYTDFNKRQNSLQQTMTVAGEKMCDFLAHVITDARLIERR